MERMRGLFLCSGIGGLELAAEETGLIDVAGQVEIDDFCVSVLAYHWPDVPRMRDVKEVRGDEFDPIDLVCAGFPCQPTSHAGKRRGQEDDRWLWPEIDRIIRCARPAWVLLENVAGLISLGLDDVLSDLDSAGYEATACVYPASAVGAPHQRERIFIVAHAAGQRRRTRRAQSTGFSGQAGSTWRSDDVANTNRQWQRQPQGRVTNERRWTHDCGEDVAHTARARLANRQQARQRTHGTQDRTGMESEPERHRTRQTQSGVGLSAHGLPGRMAGHPGWPARPGEAQYDWEAPRTVPASDKTPQRAAKLKALGNAVVPAQVLPVLQAIAETWLAEQ